MGSKVLHYYQYITYALIVFILFLPKQLDHRINFAIYLYGVYLLPIFIKKVKERLRQKDSLTISFIAFLLITGLATILSTDQSKSLYVWGIYLASFIIFLSIDKILYSLNEKLNFLKLLLTSAVLLSIISLVNTIFLHQSFDYVTFIGVHFNHNHLSGLLIFTLPLNVYFLKTNWQKGKIHFFYLIIFLIQLLALIMSFARVSIAALILSSGIVFVLAKNKQGKANLLIGFVILILIIGILIFYSLPNNLNLTKHSIYTADARWAHWRQAWENFIEHPIFGTGLDTFKTISQKHSNPNYLNTLYVHNFFLQILSDAGILALISSLLLIGNLFYRKFKSIKAAKFNSEKLLVGVILIGLLASTFNSLTDFDWQLPSILALFWLLVGLIN